MDPAGYSDQSRSRSQRQSQGQRQSQSQSQRQRQRQHAATPVQTTAAPAAVAGSAGPGTRSLPTCMMETEDFSMEEIQRLLEGEQRRDAGGSGLVRRRYRELALTPHILLLQRGLNDNSRPTALHGASSKSPIFRPSVGEEPSSGLAPFLQKQSIELDVLDEFTETQAVLAQPMQPGTRLAVSIEAAMPIEHRISMSWIAAQWLHAQVPSMPDEAPEPALGSAGSNLGSFRAPGGEGDGWRRPSVASLSSAASTALSGSLRPELLGTRSDVHLALALLDWLTACPGTGVSSTAAKSVTIVVPSHRQQHRCSSFCKLRLAAHFGAPSPELVRATPVMRFFAAPDHCSLRTPLAALKLSAASIIEAERLFQAATLCLQHHQQQREQADQEDERDDAHQRHRPQASRQSSRSREPSRARSLAAALTQNSLRELQQQQQQQQEQQEQQQRQQQQQLQQQSLQQQHGEVDGEEGRSWQEEDREKLLREVAQLLLEGGEATSAADRASEERAQRQVAQHLKTIYPEDSGALGVLLYQCGVKVLLDATSRRTKSGSKLGHDSVNELVVVEAPSYAPISLSSDLMGDPADPGRTACPAAGAALGMKAWVSRTACDWLWHRHFNGGAGQAPTSREGNDVHHFLRRIFSEAERGGSLGIVRKTDLEELILSYVQNQPETHHIFRPLLRWDSRGASQVDLGASEEDRISWQDFWKLCGEKNVLRLSERDLQWLELERRMARLPDGQEDDPFFEAKEQGVQLEISRVGGQGAAHSLANRCWSQLASMNLIKSWCSFCEGQAARAQPLSAGGVLRSTDEVLERLGRGDRALCLKLIQPGGLDISLQLALLDCHLLVRLWTSLFPKRVTHDGPVEAFLRSSKWKQFKDFVHVGNSVCLSLDAHEALQPSAPPSRSPQSSLSQSQPKGRLQRCFGLETAELSTTARRLPNPSEAECKYDECEYQPHREGQGGPTSLNRSTLRAASLDGDTDGHGDGVSFRSSAAPSLLEGSDGEQTFPALLPRRALFQSPSSPPPSQQQQQQQRRSKSQHLDFRQASFGHQNQGPSKADESQVSLDQIGSCPSEASLSECQRQSQEQSKSQRQSQKQSLRQSQSQRQSRSLGITVASRSLRQSRSLGEQHHQQQEQYAQQQQQQQHRFGDQQKQEEEEQRQAGDLRRQSRRLPSPVQSVTQDRIHQPFGDCRPFQHESESEVSPYFPTERQRDGTLRLRLLRLLPALRGEEESRLVIVAKLAGVEQRSSPASTSACAWPPGSELRFKTSFQDLAGLEQGLHVEALRVTSFHDQLMGSATFDLDANLFAGQWQRLLLPLEGGPRDLSLEVEWQFEAEDHADDDHPIALSPAGLITHRQCRGGAEHLPGLEPLPTEPPFPERTLQADPWAVTKESRLLGWMDGIQHFDDDVDAYEPHSPPLRALGARSDNLVWLSGTVLPRLWGNTGDCREIFNPLMPGSLRQGPLGDANLVAAMATLKSFPRALGKVFQKCPSQPLRGRDGLYTLVLFDPTRSFCEVDVQVNDLTPCFCTKTGAWRPLYARTSNQQLWPALLLRGVAKLLGGYRRLNGQPAAMFLSMVTGKFKYEVLAPHQHGSRRDRWQLRPAADARFCPASMQTALSASHPTLSTTNRLRGGSSKQASNSNNNSNQSKSSNNNSSNSHGVNADILTAEQLWDRLRLKSQDGEVIMCTFGTYQPEAPRPEALQGLLSGYVYPVLSALQLTIDESGRLARLVKLRNPWGESSDWLGPWSLSSPEYEDYGYILQQTENIVDDDESQCFWMSWEDFRSRASELVVSVDSFAAFRHAASLTPRARLITTPRSSSRGEKVGGGPLAATGGNSAKLQATSPRTPRSVMAAQTEPRGWSDPAPEEPMNLTSEYIIDLWQDLTPRNLEDLQRDLSSWNDGTIEGQLRLDRYPNGKLKWLSAARVHQLIRFNLHDGVRPVGDLSDVSRWSSIAERSGPTGNSSAQRQQAPQVFICSTVNSLVMQGGLGTLWLAAAVASVTEAPGLIREVFSKCPRTPHDRRNGPYALKLFDPRSNFSPVTVQVNDRVPCVARYEGGDGDGRAAGWQPVFSGALFRELWPMLLEKGIAKLLGGYDCLERRRAPIGWAAITGDTAYHALVPQRLAESDGSDMLWGLGDFDLASPDESLWSKYHCSKQVKTECDSQWAWERLRILSADGHFMVCSFRPPTPRLEDESAPDGEDDEDEEEEEEGTDHGLFPGCTYTILAVQAVREADDPSPRRNRKSKRNGPQEHRLIQLLCPIPTLKPWTGKWRRGGPDWQKHPQVARALSGAKQDATFWMSWSDFQGRVREVLYSGKAYDRGESGLLDLAGARTRSSIAMSDVTEAAPTIDVELEGEPTTPGLQPTYSAHIAGPAPLRRRGSSDEGAAPSSSPPSTRGGRMPPAEVTREEGHRQTSQSSPRRRPDEIVTQERPNSSYGIPREPLQSHHSLGQQTILSARVHQPATPSQLSHQLRPSPRSLPQEPQQFQQFQQLQQPPLEEPSSSSARAAPVLGAGGTPRSQGQRAPPQQQQHRPQPSPRNAPPPMLARPTGQPAYGAGPPPSNHRAVPEIWHEEGFGWGVKARPSGGAVSAGSVPRPLPQQQQQQQQQQPEIPTSPPPPLPPPPPPSSSQERPVTGLEPEEELERPPARQKTPTAKQKQKEKQQPQQQQQQQQHKEKEKEKEKQKQKKSDQTPVRSSERFGGSDERKSKSKDKLKSKSKRRQREDENEEEVEDEDTDEHEANKGERQANAKASKKKQKQLQQRRKLRFEDQEDRKRPGQRSSSLTSISSEGGTQSSKSSNSSTSSSNSSSSSSSSESSSEDESKSSSESEGSKARSKRRAGLEVCSTKILFKRRLPTSSSPARREEDSEAKMAEICRAAVCMLCSFDQRQIETRSFEAASSSSSSSASSSRNNGQSWKWTLVLTSGNGSRKEAFQKFSDCFLPDPSSPAQGGPIGNAALSSSRRDKKEKGPSTSTIRWFLETYTIAGYLYRNFEKKEFTWPSSSSVPSAISSNQGPGARSANALEVLKGPMPVVRAHFSWRDRGSVLGNVATTTFPEALKSVIVTILGLPANKVRNVYASLRPGGDNLMNAHFELYVGTSGHIADVRSLQHRCLRFLADISGTRARLRDVRGPSVEQFLQHFEVVEGSGRVEEALYTQDTDNFSLSTVEGEVFDRIPASVELELEEGDDLNLHSDMLQEFREDLADSLQIPATHIHLISIKHAGSNPASSAARGVGAGGGGGSNSFGAASAAAGYCSPSCCSASSSSSSSSADSASRSSGRSRERHAELHFEVSVPRSPSDRQAAAVALRYRLLSLNVPAEGSPVRSGDAVLLRPKSIPADQDGVSHFLRVKDDELGVDKGWSGESVFILRTGDETSNSLGTVVEVGDELFFAAVNGMYLNVDRKELNVSSKRSGRREFEVASIADAEDSASQRRPAEAADSEVCFGSQLELAVAGGDKLWRKRFVLEKPTPDRLRIGSVRTKGLALHPLAPQGDDRCDLCCHLDVIDEHAHGEQWVATRLVETLDLLKRVFSLDELTVQWTGSVPHAEHRVSTVNFRVFGGPANCLRERALELLAALTRKETTDWALGQQLQFYQQCRVRANSPVRVCMTHIRLPSPMGPLQPSDLGMQVDRLVCWADIVSLKARPSASGPSSERVGAEFLQALLVALSLPAGSASILNVLSLEPFRKRLLFEVVVPAMRGLEGELKRISDGLLQLHRTDVALRWRWLPFFRHFALESAPEWEHASPAQASAAQSRSLPKLCAHVDIVDFDGRVNKLLFQQPNAAADLKNLFLESLTTTLGLESKTVVITNVRFRPGHAMRSFGDSAVDSNWGLKVQEFWDTFERARAGARAAQPMRYSEQAIDLDDEDTMGYTIEFQVSAPPGTDAVSYLDVVANKLRKFHSNAVYRAAKRSDGFFSLLRLDSGIQIESAPGLLPHRTAYQVRLAQRPGVIASTAILPPSREGTRCGKASQLAFSGHANIIEKPGRVSYGQGETWKDILKSFAQEVEQQLEPGLTATFVPDLPTFSRENSPGPLTIYLHERCELWRGLRIVFVGVAKKFAHNLALQAEYLDWSRPAGVSAAELQQKSAAYRIDFEVYYIGNDRENQPVEFAKQVRDMILQMATRVSSARSPFTELFMIDRGIQLDGGSDHRSLGIGSMHPQRLLLEARLLPTQSMSGPLDHQAITGGFSSTMSAMLGVKVWQVQKVHSEVTGKGILIQFEVSTQEHAPAISEVRLLCLKVKALKAQIAAMEEHRVWWKEFGPFILFSLDEVGGAAAVANRKRSRHQDTVDVDFSLHDLDVNHLSQRDKERIQGDIAWALGLSSSRLHYPSRHPVRPSHFPFRIGGFEGPREVDHFLERVMRAPKNCFAATGHWAWGSHSIDRAQRAGSVGGAVVDEQELLLREIENMSLPALCSRFADLREAFFRRPLELQLREPAGEGPVIDGRPLLSQILTTTWRKLQTARNKQNFSPTPAPALSNLPLREKQKFAWSCLGTVHEAACSFMNTDQIVLQAQHDPGRYVGIQDIDKQRVLFDNFATTEFSKAAVFKLATVNGALALLHRGRRVSYFHGRLQVTAQGASGVSVSRWQRPRGNLDERLTVSLSAADGEEGSSFCATGLRTSQVLALATTSDRWRLELIGQALDCLLYTVRFCEVEEAGQLPPLRGLLSAGRYPEIWNAPCYLYALNLESGEQTPSLEARQRHGLPRRTDDPNSELVTFDGRSWPKLGDVVQVLESSKVGRVERKKIRCRRTFGDGWISSRAESEGQLMVVLTEPGESMQPGAQSRLPMLSYVVTIGGLDMIAAFSYGVVQEFLKTWPLLVLDKAALPSALALLASSLAAFEFLFDVALEEGWLEEDEAARTRAPVFWRDPARIAMLMSSLALELLVKHVEAVPPTRVNDLMMAVKYCVRLTLSAVVRPARCMDQHRDLLQRLQQGLVDLFSKYPNLVQPGHRHFLAGAIKGIFDLFSDPPSYWAQQFGEDRQGPPQLLPLFRREFSEPAM